jgi:hypothetical protein
MYKDIRNKNILLSMVLTIITLIVTFEFGYIILSIFIAALALASIYNLCKNYINRNKSSEVLKNGFDKTINELNSISGNNRRMRSKFANYNPKPRKKSRQRINGNIRTRNTKY